jgi:hypothetical protein
MNINEIDFRYSWIVSIYEALESGLSSIEKRGIENVWPVNLTTETLANVGITDKTDFPCYKAATILWVEKECKNLGNLLNIVSEWREFILMKYK